MSNPVYTRVDYVGGLLAHLPKGRVWPREADAPQNRALTSLMTIYERVGARGRDVLYEAFPPKTNELLVEWEATLGLPGVCGNEFTQTIAERRAAVVAKFIGSGGQSVAYFIALAASLGYAITITEFRPFTVASLVSESILGDGWASAWQVNSAIANLRHFTVSSRVNETLTAWGDTALECLIKQAAPAHTAVLFAGLSS